MSADLSVHEYTAGCKALETINKIVMGPPWRVLECKEIAILDMNERFRTLLSCLNDWLINASSVVAGETVVFDDFPP